MKLFRVLIEFLLLSAILTFAVYADAPKIFAESYCLIDGDTGRILFSQNENEKLPIASTTKIMTAICVIENASLDKRIIIPKEACRIEGSSLYLTEGMNLSIRDLLYGLMLRSANDSAVALSVAVSGNTEKFAELMNETANKIGMKNSNFRNPHGLNEEGHFSTAFDLACLMKYAMQNTVFREITGTKSYVIKGEGINLAVSNHNRLLSSYEYCIGGKTGFTRNAGRCLVSCAEKNGKKLIAVTLNCGDDWNSHKALYESGYNLYTERKLIGTGEIRMEIPVCGGVLDKVFVTNLDELSLFVLNGGEIHCEIELPKFLYAPIIGNDGIDFGSDFAGCGKAKFYQEGRLIGEIDLYPETSIERYHKKTIIEKIIEFITSLWKEK